MPDAKIIFVVFIIAILAIIAISIALSGGVNSFLERIRLAIVTGTLTIGAEAPNVKAIYLEHHVPSLGLTNCTEDFNDCYADPLAGGTRNPTIKVMVRDLNGCEDDNQFDVFVHVCKPGTSPCNENNYDMMAELNYLEKDPLDASYCNYSYQGALIGFDYFETPSTDIATRYEFYVNATDDDGTTWNTNDPYNVYFTYSVLVDFLYPGPGSGDTIRMGTLNLGEWNNGTGDTAPTDPNAWNRGNVEQDVLWRATDFTSGPNILQITGSNYVIDDDKNSNPGELADVGSLTEAYINDDPIIDVEFPATNLQFCSNLACDGAGDDDARFDIYWHIFIPSLQATGVYANSITITNSQA